MKYKQLENKASEFICVWASRVVLVVKNPSAFEGDIRDEGLILFKGLGCEDPLEEGMTTHSSILAWRILFLPGESYSYLENPRDRGAWWAFYGVAQSRTRLKRLSSSSIYI